MTDPAPTRTSTRVRTKSARALESEGTEALIAAQGPARATRSKAPREKVAPKPKKSKYCLCKEYRTGPMIECNECGNWFHFSCVELTDEEAEKIHNWVCTECAQRTGSKTTYIHDISSFPSPVPPSDAELEAEAEAEEPQSKRNTRRAASKRKAPRRTTTRAKKAKVEEPGPDLEPEPEPEPELDVEGEDNDEDGDGDDEEDGAASSVESVSTPGACDELVKGDADEYKDEGEKEDDHEDRMVGHEVSPSLPPAKSLARRGVRGRSKSPVKRAGTPSPVNAIEQEAKEETNERAEDGPKGRTATPTKGHEKGKEPSHEHQPRASKRLSIDTRRGSGSTKLSTPARRSSAHVKLKGALPAARAYVLGQFTKIASGLFGDKLDASGAAQWGKDAEAALFAHFKEGPNAVAGNRYKAQFTLLSSSLPKTRAAVKAAIVDGSTPPDKVALLNAEDLATDEQLAELEAQRAESLRQAVRIEPEFISVRIGRDGLEEIEREKTPDSPELKEEEELACTSQVDEQRARGTATPEPPKAAAESPRSPGSPFMRRRSSISTPLSPLARRTSFSHSGSPVVAHRSSVEFASAWGTSTKVAEDYDMEQDQDAIDLSDLATGDVNYDDGLDGPEAHPMAEFFSRPVVWSGGISNPAEESAIIPSVVMRQAAGRGLPVESFRALLPQATIAIAGRVPSVSSLQYLSDRRLDGTKELVTVALTLGPKATTDERKAWGAILNFHLQRDRHAVFHPNTNARELYLVPVRAADRTPELFDTFDAFALPKDARDEAVMLGVFVTQRVSPGRSPTEPNPVSRSLARPPPQAQPSDPLEPAAPVFQNAQLQALMSSLNPAAIAAASAPRPPHAGMPMPPFPPSYGPGPGPPRPDYSSYQPDRPRPRADHAADYHHDRIPAYNQPGYSPEYRPDYQFRPTPTRPYGVPQPSPYGVTQGYHPPLRPQAGHASPPPPGGRSPATGMRSESNRAPPGGSRGGPQRGRGRGRRRW
ncbi:hypothetical protein CspeluHIS016_0209380 [Cutaneotrichosporon spelunceum]|uniref:PHD-type domain-containing protein n=1 Tax=Cutaneotrichosporon spelunceum TaxID=1672016 RepID=A0AAD3YBG1_9TREE|nr:hypothetical protein CspeluHIS016_0209380 [Cutaneotrichosporon spelunceum]